MYQRGNAPSRQCGLVWERQFCFLLIQVGCSQPIIYLSAASLTKVFTSRAAGGGLVICLSGSVHGHCSTAGAVSSLACLGIGRDQEHGEPPHYCHHYSVWAFGSQSCTT